MQCISAVSLGFFTWKEERSTSQGPYLLVWITLELLYLVLHLLLLLYLDLLYTVEYWKEKGNCIILQHIWTIWNPPEDNGNSVKCTNIWQCAYYWQYLTMCIILPIFDNVHNIDHQQKRRYGAMYFVPHPAWQWWLVEHISNVSTMNNWHKELGRIINANVSSPPNRTLV